MNLKGLALSGFLAVNSLFSNSLDSISNSNYSSKIKLEKLNDYLNSKNKPLKKHEYWKAFRIMYSNQHPIMYAFPNKINEKLLESSLQYLSNHGEENQKSVLSNLMKYRTIGELEKASKMPNPSIATLNPKIDPNADLQAIINGINNAMLNNLPDLYKNSINATLKTISYYMCFDYVNEFNENSDQNGIVNKFNEVSQIIESRLHANQMQEIMRSIAIGFREIKNKNQAKYMEILSTPIDDFQTYNDHIEDLSKKAKDIQKFVSRLENRKGVGFSRRANRKLKDFKSFYQGKKYEELLQNHKNELTKVLKSTKPEEISIGSYIDIMSRQPHYILDIFKNLNRDFEVIKILDSKKRYEEHYKLDFRGYENFFKLQDPSNFTLNSKTELLAYNFGRELIEQKLYEFCDKDSVKRIIGMNGIDSSTEMINGLHLLTNTLYKKSNDKNFLDGLLRVLVLPLKNLENDVRQLIKTPKVFKKEGWRDSLIHFIQYGLRTGIDIYLLEKYNAKSIAKNYSVHFALDNNKITQKAYRNAFLNAALQFKFYIPSEQNFDLEKLIQDSASIPSEKNKSLKLKKSLQLIEQINYIQKVMKYNMFVNVLDLEKTKMDLKRSKNATEDFFK